MKGVTLAAVGIVAIKLLGGSIPSERALLLAVALGSVLVSYNGEAIGQAIIHLPPATVDVALPMALTVAELLVVGLAAVNSSLGPMPAAWFAAFAAWNLMAAVLVKSVAERLDPQLYDRCLWPALKNYRGRMRFDARCAAAVGCATVVFLLWRLASLPEAGIPEYVFLAFAGISFVGALAHHEATRKELREALLAIADPAR